jgi:Cu(I)/Ag(I) efflux system membrane protein CusA/SilA
MILVIPQGTTIHPRDLEKLDDFRTQWVDFFAQETNSVGAMDTGIGSVPVTADFESHTFAGSPGQTVRFDSDAFGSYRLAFLLSIPFALVGSVWLLWFLDFRLSTAVYVGIIALVGLAAQTGIIMIVYIDQAYERRKRAGKIRDLQDIIHAHMEGTVMRVRPKLMTVGTMLIGLIPLLWATGSGADVMKRIAAPMVGGLITSAFLTLEIIPVISTYWRREQVLWERLEELDPKRLLTMKLARAVLSVGWVTHAALWISTIYVMTSATVFNTSLIASGIAIVGGTVAYSAVRPAAIRQVWPPHVRVPERISP